MNKSSFTKSNLNVSKNQHHILNYCVCCHLLSKLNMKQDASGYGWLTTPDKLFPGENPVRFKRVEMYYCLTWLKS